MSTDPTIEQLALSQEELVLARFVYMLTGYFDFGSDFRPDVIPARHVATLMPLYVKYLNEEGAPASDFEQVRELYQKLTGEVMPRVELPKRTHTQRATQRPHERPITTNAAASRRATVSLPSGNIDYASVIERAMGDAA